MEDKITSEQNEVEPGGVEMAEDETSISLNEEDYKKLEKVASKTINLLLPLYSAFSDAVNKTIGVFAEVFAQKDIVQVLSDLNIILIEEQRDQRRKTYIRYNRDKYRN